MDTCRHYKEFIRRLFNHAHESGIYLPANPHAPNPAAGLSSFVNTERDIVVLTPEEEAGLHSAAFPQHLRQLCTRIRVEPCVGARIKAGECLAKFCQFVLLES